MLALPNQRIPSQLGLGNTYLPYSWKFYLMYFDRFDICQAYQVFTLKFGARSWELARFEKKVADQLHRLRYKPSILWANEPYELEENARAIYLGLVDKYFPRRSTAS